MSSIPNRRRRVRHRVQTPAYATFTGESRSAMLDLHEIVDISEDGVSIQSHEPLDVGRRLNLCLDLAESSEHIYTTGHVVWTHATGRTGLRFSGLAPVSMLRLREWLFLNAMSGLAEAGEAALAPPTAPAIAAPVTTAPVTPEPVPPQPGYTDTLAALTAVQREVEALGSDLAAALRLTAARAQTLVRASGAAIALSDSVPDFMICRASSGSDAPPVGTRLQVGSGFSGECVKSGRLLRCDDTDLDSRVDRDSCRALGIRSILAAPVRVGDKSIGILEAFSPHTNAFTEDDSTVLQRLADTVLAAVNRAARAENLPLPGEPAPPPAPFRASPGSVLFAAVEDPKEKKDPHAKDDDDSSSGGITLPRSHLILLICTAATIFLALGYHSGYYIVPWLQNKVLHRERGQLPTVLASSQAPKSDSPAVLSGPSVETASFDQLLQMAHSGDSNAQNIVGLRYATGDGVKLNEQEAVRWLTLSAEQGNIAAQSKLGALYFRGKTIAKDLNRAYFWMVLARASGDETSKVLAPSIAARLTREQATSIELDASRWLQQHEPTAKPSPGH